MSGHVFVVYGDLRRLACDAWLMPCDSSGRPLPQWFEEPEPLPPSFVWPDRRASVGSDTTRVLKVPGWPASRPQPWLTNVWSGPGRPDTWFVEGAKQFLEAAGKDLAGAPARSGRAKPLIALPIVGTGVGGGSPMAGAIVCRLLEVLYHGASVLDVDVALVTNDGASFAAAQAQRPRTIAAPWPALDERLQQQARRLADLAARGQLVLFLGAGVSRSAGLPLWLELLLDLAKDTGLPTDDGALQRLNPLDQAQIIERRMGGTARLGEAVARRLHLSYHGLSHALLAALPISEAVTTNYDQLFEIACEAIRRPTAVLPYQSAAGCDRWLLKMHGCVSQPNEIVLTRAAYLRYADNRAALGAIVQALLITRHMLFVGFSLDDDNFHQIIDAVRKAFSPARPRGTVAPPPRAPFGTALALYDEQVLQELWQNDLCFVAMTQREHSATPMAAGRRLEIFLDLVLARTSSVHHLMDRRFDAILSSAERELREAIARFRGQVDALDPALKQTAPWSHIERMLKNLGG